MGKAASIVLGAALAAVTGGFGAPLAFSFSQFAGSLILGGLSYALTSKPKKPAFENNMNSKGQTVAVRQPDLTRQHVYGHVRITRGYAHMESTGLNGTLHMVLMLCEGPLRAINEIWVNDYCIPQDWIDSEGNVTQGRYAGYMTIRKHLGTETQLADEKAVFNMPNWTSDHRLQGIAYLYITMKKNQDVFPTGVPNITAIVEGPLVFDPRVDDFTWSTNLALFSHDYIVNDLYGYSAFSDDFDLVNVAAQANISDEIVTTTPLEMKGSSVDVTNNILVLQDDILLFQFGDRVNISTDGVLPGGLSSETDYYVIPYQVKSTPRILLAASLDDSMAKTAVEITSAGTGNFIIRKTGEPRYHGGGVLDTDTPLNNTLNDLVTCMAGRAIQTGGFWTLLAGAYRTPENSYGISDIRGKGYNLKNSLTIGESYNIVKGLFTSSINLYQQTDYPSAVYPTFIDEDNGKESTKDMNLNYTNRPTTAQRIAKIELFRSRQGIAFSSDFSMRGLEVKPGDVTNMNIDFLGWEDKPFEITEFRFNVNDGNMVTHLAMRETAEAIYNWNSGEAIDFDPAPNTNLPNIFIVFAASGVFYNSREIGTRDGDVVYALTLNWDTHPDSFVLENGDFEIQYKLSSEDTWRPSFFVDGSLTRTDVLNSSANVEYDVRIRARNNLGVRSGWVTIEDVVVGSSGGVGTTYDWDFVYNSVTTYNDWGNVTDTPTEYEDWGYVV
jgi:hypothetical protein